MGPILRWQPAVLSRGSESSGLPEDPPVSGETVACPTVAPSQDATQPPLLMPQARERTLPAMIPPLQGQICLATCQEIGTAPPGRDHRRWIEAAIRRMFRCLRTIEIDILIEAFREWRLPPCAAIYEQGSPINTGPGLCVLYVGVVDVLHRASGCSENEKVCTYDRCGQCFGELELFFDTPKALGGGRKSHWATVATRTPATLWTIPKTALRGTSVS